MHGVIGCHPESDAILGAGFLPIVVGSSLAGAASGRTVKYASVRAARVRPPGAAGPTEADLRSLDSYHNPNARIIEPAATPMYCWPSTVYVIGPAFHC